MIKLVYCVRRRADLSPADFYKYWHTQHAPKVKGVAKAIGAVKYIQSHTCASDMNAMLKASRGLKDPYDGITEVWWESEASMAAAISTPEGQAAMKLLLDDEANFIDFSDCAVFMTQEHGIFDYT